MSEGILHDPQLNINPEVIFLKILVMSDSHGSKSNMFDAIKIESPDVVLFLGDNIRDCEDIESKYPKIMLRAVRGNCDQGYRGLDMDEFVLEGKKFFMTHGHLFSVKLGKTKIMDTATARSIDILLFGHTHIPYQSEKDGLIAINPGSIGSDVKSYAVLEIKNGAVECKLKKL